MEQVITVKASSRYIFIGLAIMVASLPFVSSNQVTFLINRLSIFLTVLVWLFQFRFSLPSKSWLLPKNKLLISFLSLYLLELVGVFYSANLAVEFSSIEKKLPLLIFPLVLLTMEPLSAERIKLLLRIFVGTVTVASLICLGYAFHRNNYLEVFNNPNWFYFSYSDLTEIISLQPIYFSLFVSFSFFSLLFHINENWKIMAFAIKVLTVLWSIYLFVFLLFLAGKASILSTTILFIITVFFFLYKKKHLVFALVCAITIMAISGLLIYQLPIVRERFMSALGMNKTSIWVYGHENSTPTQDARLIKWTAAARVIQNNWIVGVGAGDVQDELNKEYKKLNFQIGIEENFNAHNQYLQTWLGLGIVGLVALFATLTIGINKSQDTKNYIYLIFIALVSTNFLTESLLERQYGLIFYSFFNCLLFTLKTTHSGDDRSAN